MTVRVKILAISVILLLLFAGVLFASVAMQRRTSYQVAAITEFHLPLAAVIADLDVATDQYELILQRLLVLPDVTPAAVKAGRLTLEKDKARIAEDFQTADTVVERALADPRTDPGDRVVLAKVQRTLVFLKRQEEPFLAVGEEIMKALESGRTREARALAPRFKAFEQAF